MKNIKPTRQSTNGTSFHNQTIIASLNAMVKVFGEPEYWDDEKVTCEWQFELQDGTVFTIYDWKESSSPTNHPDSVIEWHIGSMDRLNPEQYTQILYEIQS